MDTIAMLRAIGFEDTQFLSPATYYCTDLPLLLRSLTDATDSPGGYVRRGPRVSSIRERLLA